MVDSDVFRFFKPVYVLLNCFYIGPDYLKASNEKPTNKYVYLIVVSGLVLGFIFLSYYALGDIRNLHRQSDKVILLNLDRVSVSLEAVIVLVVFVVNYKYRNEIPKLLEILDDFDKAASFQFNRKLIPGKVLYKFRYLYLLHFVASFVIYGIDLDFNLNTFGRVQFYTIARLISCLFRDLMVFEYVSVMGLIYLRFKYLNNYVSRMKVEPVAKSILTPVLTVSVISRNGSKFKKTMAKREDDIKLCRILHDSLCEVSQEVDRIFGLLHVICIITTAVEQISEVFSIFLVFKEDDLDDIYSAVYRSILQLYLNLFVHFHSVFYFCDLLMKEVTFYKSKNKQLQCSVIKYRQTKKKPVKFDN